jgi:hypothetical protein
MTRFLCPHCRKTLKAPAHAGGRKTSCPRCRKRLVVPAPVAPVAGDWHKVPPPVRPPSNTPDRDFGEDLFEATKD